MGARDGDADADTDDLKRPNLTTLGLRALPLGVPASSVPSHAAFFLLANFVSAYLVLAPRHPKQWYGFDHKYVHNLFLVAGYFGPPAA